MSQNYHDVRVDEFRGIRTFVRMPIVTIYKNPLDYPDKFVARLFDINVPTKYIIVKNNFEELEDILIGCGMMGMAPCPGDEEHIVAVFI